MKRDYPMSGTGFVQLVKLTAFGVNFPLCYLQAYIDTLQQ
jgi:hypothetical protein